MASVYPVIVDTPAQVTGMLDIILAHPGERLYIDLEGEQLSCRGTLDLISIHVEAAYQTWLVDVHTLGDCAFSTTATADGYTTLRSVPESVHRVKSVVDIQLLELASRRGFKDRYLLGLSKCISRCDRIYADEKARWQETKEKDRQLLLANSELFRVRPLVQDTLLYCAGDVALLPRLLRQFEPFPIGFWRWFAAKETRDRIKEAHENWYRPEGPEKADAPWIKGILIARKQEHKVETGRKA
ncbi:uncharacterized protein BO97DRAFT_460448 [Aspergillus homomorphus CBS 101889]|uniref:3'-5' exonuclease domain-containing protein n=1 Tax=Aspergillus homomorphus (strain CBS 101889) TaxID=1450537 RepID=A0A395HNN0_ASPHC|nr:hypothetical protein BO97DRAFT_460448 [Aspergillus homomorphus CBS 101889]RAL08448.1 hypothetical protein BO97DRAFT_460448 [Aspergillus homomorphus CBS 101889]